MDKVAHRKVSKVFGLIYLKVFAVHYRLYNHFYEKTELNEVSYRNRIKLKRVAPGKLIEKSTVVTFLLNIDCISGSFTLGLCYSTWKNFNTLNNLIYRLKLKSSKTLRLRFNETEIKLKYFKVDNSDSNTPSETAYILEPVNHVITYFSILTYPWIILRIQLKRKIHLLHYQFLEYTQVL